MKATSVLPFNTRKGNEYLFDGNTSTVMPVNTILKEAIISYPNKTYNDLLESLLLKYPDKKNEIIGCLKFVDNWYKNNKGFYRNESYNSSKKFWLDKFTTKDISEVFRSGNTYQLILNVTEDCNLKCKYCYLSEVYDYTRNHTHEKMDEETAIKSLDYFFKQIEPVSKFNPGKECAITFYGGEPLLNFEVIKKSIEYAEKNSPTPVMFNLTTNAVLLKDEIADYLVSHNVNISISFDGTKENHDRNRVFKKNEGSYDMILKNILDFKRKYVNYNRINIISVFDFKTDLEANDIFFAENDLPPVVFVNGVSNHNTKYHEQFSQDTIDRYTKQYRNLLNKYVDYKINDKECSSYLRVLFESTLSSIIFRARPKDTKLPILPFTNTCIPGMKISIRVDGTFDMCERVNETLPIGNLDEGLSLDAIKKILVEYNSTVAVSCHDCPISNVCPVCFAQCLGDGEFSKPNCNVIINNFVVLLSIVYSILEENPKAFEVFEPKIEWFIYN